MREAGITLKLKKCHCFALPEWKFCGQIVGSGTRRADPDKMAAVEAIKAPETKKQVRQTMGFFNYFRESIPNFAAIAKPLTDLTKKSRSNKICWGDQVVGLKKALQRAVTTHLRIIDQNKD